MGELTEAAIGSIDGFAAWCRENGIENVIPGTADTNGAWIGKTMPLDDFVRAYRSHGVAHSDVLFTITRDGMENIFAPEGAKARPLPYTVLIERRARAVSARRARS